MIPIDVASLPQSRATLPIPKGIQTADLIELDRSSASNEPIKFNPPTSGLGENAVIRREVVEENGRTTIIERKKDGTPEVQVLVKD
jgi:hypothetical protein